MVRNVRKAFTLVEILIVVVILGILAAIVVPQFTSATQDSQAGNIKSQMGTLQRQIELYYAKYNTYPAFSGASYTGWDELVNAGMLKEAPRNPSGVMTVAQRGTVVPGTGAATGIASAGWVFNTTNNRLYASFFHDIDPAALDFGTVSAVGTD